MTRKRKIVSVRLDFSVPEESNWDISGWNWEDLLDMPSDPNDLGDLDPAEEDYDEKQDIAVVSVSTISE